ncbi:T9SS type B sorting domain-containing protein [Aquimarina agarivorans]|uniref:T9SS type B sorting domain-containing protein n=1 Tax=Aquimarina agarivorans TaxID=980584 RepID=UPI000248E9EA|nr:T9SS type B sorting domain-containing protein [Aquimarina agarivorans]
MRKLLFFVSIFIGFVYTYGQTVTLEPETGFGTTICSGSTIQVNLDIDPPSPPTNPTGSYNINWERINPDGSSNFLRNGNFSDPDNTFQREIISTPGVTRFRVRVDGTEHFIDITVNPIPNAGFDSEIFLCGKSGVINLFDELDGGPEAGGSWSNGTGTYDTTDASGGSFTYTLPGGGVCPDQTAVINVRPCGNNDIDNDGITNDVDLDDDNDGITDVLENGFCTPASLSPVFVLEEDFGFGSPTRSKFSEGLGLQYNPLLPQDTMNDGEYNVATSTFFRTGVGFDATFLASDLNGDVDANGDVDGRYLAINMKSAVFLNKPVFVAKDLPVVPGLEYDFSMSIANFNSTDGILPNLTIEIVDQSTGMPIISRNSGPISNNMDAWQQFDEKFTPLPGVTIVTVQVVNNQGTPGNGNDIAIDNIFLSTPACDFDRDGIPNSEDLDSDNDGIYDIVENNEAAKDADGDGRVDTQSDSGTITTIVNSDSDSNPDYLDVDSDNDGIIDHVEAMETANYIAPSGSDGDFNGVDDSYDSNGTPVVLADSDTDGTPDYLDNNSDDDCLDDTVEAYDLDQDGVSDILNAAFNDTDNDGLDNDYDTEVLGRLTSNTNGTNGGQEPSAFPDVHNPGGDLDWREEFIATPIVITDVADVCQGATADFNLFNELNTKLAALTPPVSSVPDTGSWTVPTSGNAITGGHLATLDVSTTMTEMNYVYTLPRVGSCPERTFTLPVEVTPIAFAGEDAIISRCTSDPVFDLFDELLDRADGTMPSPGGVWTLGTTTTVFGADDKGTFDPSSDMFGVYTYTVNGGAGCGSDTATVDISIGGANPGVAPTSPVMFCSDDTTTTDLFTLLTNSPQSGGIWTLPDGVTTFDGMLTPSAVSFTSGMYTYEVSAAGCPPGSVDVEVVITDIPEIDVLGARCDATGPSATVYEVTTTLTGSGTVTSDFGVVDLSDPTRPKITDIPKNQDVVLTITPTGNPACSFTRMVTAPNCDCPVVNDPTNPSNEVICEEDAIPTLSVTLDTGLVGRWYLSDGSPIASAQSTDSYTPTADQLSVGVNTFVVEAADATGCPSNQINVRLTIIEKPRIVLPTVVESCGEFVLAPLAIGNYFDAPVGDLSRTMLSVGDVFMSSDTVYIFAENIDAASGQVCASEEEFNFTVNPLPTPVAPTIESAYCNSFVLPPLADPATQKYFTSTGGGGSELNPGDAVTSTQEIFIQETSSAGCVDEISFTINIENITGDPGTNGMLNLCINDMPVSLISGLQGSPSNNGSWTLPDGSVNTDPNFEIDPATADTGTYTYTINSSSVCTGLSADVEVSILGIPTPTLPASLSITAQCETFTLPSLPVGQFYSTISLATDPTITGDLAEGQVLTSTTDLFLVEENANGCKGEVPFVITIENLPSFTLSGDTVCVDSDGNVDPVTITTPLNTTDFDLQWALNGADIAGENEAEIVATRIGDYTIRYSSRAAASCSGEETTTIMPIESPENLTFETGLNTVQLFTTKGNDLEYTLLGIDNSFVATQLGNVFRNVPPGDYLATVSNLCNSLSVEVSVFGFPEFFSPNGDSDNESWNVKGNPGDTKITISVFDRYGRLMASFSPESRGWNGTYNDLHMPADDYWYYAKTDNGEEYRGHFALLR